MLEKNYTPKDFEEKIYEKWENDGDFKPDMRDGKDAFCVINLLTVLTYLEKLNYITTLSF